LETEELSAPVSAFQLRVRGRAKAIVAAAIVAALGMADAKSAQAQSEPADLAALKFASSSIKTAPHTGIGFIPRMWFTADGYRAGNATLRALIKDAYGVGDNQIVGGPGWIGSTEYQLDAKIDGATVDALRKLDSGQRGVARHAMLQALLADRFKLAFHRETRQLPVYSLIIAKNGAKIHPATPGDTYSNGLKTPSGTPLGPGKMLTKDIDGTSGDGGEIAGQGMPFTRLVEQLSKHLGQNVSDRTGMTGNYDFDLQWGLHQGEDGPIKGPDVSQHRDNNGATPLSAGQSLFIAIEQQLGLKLELAKGPVECLVIDRADKPPAN
jgi:uncharacterized protein (TIGR03435 family)